MDYNNDGYLDLLIGERNGKSFLYAGSSSGLQAGINLKANGEVIDAGENSSPCLVDWNEDGYLDLVLGGYPENGAANSGFLRVYLNDRSNPNELNFTTFTKLSFWKKNRTTQDVFDLDRDGDKDLILGHEGGKVFFAENTGTNSAPVFNGYVTIKMAGKDIDFGGRARESVCDWNEDGIPDLVLCNTTDDKIRVLLGGDVAIEENNGTPNSTGYNFSIAENPSSGLVTLNMDVQAACRVSVSIHDCSGRTVTDLTRALPAGNSTMSFDIHNNPLGLYMVRADFGDMVLSGKIVLAK